MKPITRTYSSSWGVEWTNAYKVPRTVPGMQGELSPCCAVASVPHLQGCESVQWFWVAGRPTSSCFPLHVKVRTTHLDLLAKEDTVWILWEARGLWERSSTSKPSLKKAVLLWDLSLFSSYFWELLKKDSMLELGSYLSPPLLWFLMHLSRLLPGLGHHSPSPGDFCLFTS